jgi:trimeric autotransporter adhesin
MKFCYFARALALLCVLGSFGVLAGCGARSVKLTHIVITPENQTVANGTTLQLNATGYYSDGTTESLDNLATWQVKQPEKATISPEGNLTALSEGFVEISATYAEVTGATFLRIGPPELTSITVGPSQSFVPLGETEQLTATGKFSDGTTKDLTQSATWSSSALDIATISPAGLATAMAQGSTTLTAASGTVQGVTSLTVTAAVLTSVAVTPAGASIPAGKTQQCIATGIYSNGGTQNLTSTAIWTSTAPTVAKVSTGGMATGMTVGASSISATISGVTGSTVLTVMPAALGSITVTPANPSVAAGDQQQLTATGTYTDGSTQNLTSTATWSSLSPSVATISTGGTATGVSTGTSNITATQASITGSTTLTVTAAVLVSIAVTPPSPSVAAGYKQQFTAIGTYGNGTTQNLTSTATWTSSAPSVATINAAGLATGLAKGTSIIGATLSGISGSTTLIVTAPVLVSMAVTPANPSIPIGSTQSFTATGTYSDGSTQNLTGTANWSSSNTSVATIGTTPGSPGLATATGFGTTTIQAASGSINNSTTLTVTAGFVPTGSLNTPRASHTSTLLTNGMVLISGGYNGTLLASAELYSPATGTFTPTGSLNAARLYHTATLLDNGMVLIAGGSDHNGNVLASAELYNPATGAFTPTGSLNTARELHTATMIVGTGIVLIAGGHSSNGALASAELYDPATGTFTATGNLSNARFSHTATLLNNGTVLMAGGIDKSGSPSATAEMYNPATATFVPALSLNTARYRHTTTLLNGGQVLLAGGEDANGNAIASSELYNPVTGTFVPGGTMNTARILHSSTLINNGTDLVAGGYGSNVYLNSAEVDDPIAATFSSTGSLNTARYLHTATLLNNGMDLVAGGYNSNGYLSSAELYEPATLTPPNLVSIALSPANPTIPLDTTQQFVATGTFNDGSTQQLASVTWSSSSTAVAPVTGDASNSGAAYAVSQGPATMTACAGAICGSTTLTVGPAALVSISVSPASSTLPSGETLKFSATGTYTDGSTKHLNSGVQWSSSNPTAATISAAGVASGVSMGTSTITATVGAITGTAVLTVTGATVVGLNISPATLLLAPGSSSQLLAIANMSDGTTEEINGIVTWSMQGPYIATISNFGLVTAQQIGSATIIAQSSKFTATASLTVLPVTALSIMPSTFSMAGGTSAQFQCIATLADGTTMNITSIAAWSSAQPPVASVNTTGLVTAAQDGGTTIQAAAAGFTASSSLTVLTPTALNIQPSTVSMVIGSARQLHAIASFSNGTTQDVTTKVAWSASQPAIASVTGGGLVTGNHVGSTTISASAGGLTASAAVTVMPLLLVTYFNLPNAVKSGDDGIIRLVNPGVVPGDICAMIYVFDRNQEMNECCGCTISDSGLLTLSLVNDLTANTLNGAKPVAGSIEIIPSDYGQSATCNAAKISPDAALSGWSTHVQSSQGTYNVTEESLSRSALVTSEATVLATECSMIQQLGSGKGICSCGTGN